MNTNIFKTAIAALALLVVFNSCKEEKTKFHIEVACNPERGTVTGTGDYAEGSKVTISAAGKDGYRFIGWKEYSALTDSVVTINIVSDRTYTAIFCKADVIEKFQNGYKKTSETIDEDTIRYEAVPDENCYFLKWSNGEIKPVIETQEAISDLTPIFRQYPEGSIHAVFFVSETKRVIFSKGNLQFNPTLGTHTRADGTTAPGTWRFAEKQTDYFKGDSIVSATYDGWICHFAWGTSGWSGSGATYYQPYDGYIYIYSNDKTYGPEGANADSIAKLYGPQGNYDLTGDYAYADWGVYNPISNGGNKPGMWRTLSRDEFYYFVKNNYKIQPITDFYCFYEGEVDPIFNDYREIKDKNLDDWIKVIDAKNDLLFFYNYFGLEVWTASSDEDYDYEVEMVDVYHVLNDMYFLEYRSKRHPVRLVMDVDE